MGKTRSFSSLFERVSSAVLLQGLMPSQGLAIEHVRSHAHGSQISFALASIGIKRGTIQHLIASQTDVAQHMIIQIEQTAVVAGATTPAQQAADKSFERKLTLSQISQINNVTSHNQHSAIATGAVA
jgi:hypothetical protein